MKSKILLLIFFFYSGASSALYIDSGTYFTDTSTGLDWLKLIETIDRSIPDIQRQLEIGGEYAGWEYATETQLEEFLIGFGATPTPRCTNRLFCTSSTENNGIAIGLIELLGNTYNGVIGDGTPAMSLGILADTNSRGFQYVAWIDESNDSYDYINTRHYSAPVREDYSFINGGSFLVRPTNVPEPSTLALISIGLFFLMKRDKSNNTKKA